MGQNQKMNPPRCPFEPIKIDVFKKWVRVPCPPPDLHKLGIELHKLVAELHKLCNSMHKLCISKRIMPNCSLTIWVMTWLRRPIARARWGRWVGQNYVAARQSKLAHCSTCW